MRSAASCAPALISIPDQLTVRLQQTGFSLERRGIRARLRYQMSAPDEIWSAAATSSRLCAISVRWRQDKRSEPAEKTHRPSSGDWWAGRLASVGLDRARDILRSERRVCNGLVPLKTRTGAQSSSRRFVSRPIASAADLAQSTPSLGCLLDAFPKVPCATPNR